MQRNYTDKVREISVKTLGIRQSSRLPDRAINPVDQQRIKSYFKSLRQSFTKKDFDNDYFRKEVTYQLIDRLLNREWSQLVTHVDQKFNSLGIMITIVTDKKFKKFLKDNVDEINIIDMVSSNIVQTQRGVQILVFKNESDASLINLMFHDRIRKQINLNNKVEHLFQIVDQYFTNGAVYD